MTATGGVHQPLISGAYGGFSSVWGAVILPFPKDAFVGWPVLAEEMAQHYRAVLSMIPFAPEHDDLAGELPLYAQFASLPPLSTRAGRILDAYRQHRSASTRPVSSWATLALLFARRPAFSVDSA